MKAESKEWHEVRRLNCPTATMGWEESACFSAQGACVLNSDRVISWAETLFP